MFKIALFFIPLSIATSMLTGACKQSSAPLPSNTVVTEKATATPIPASSPSEEIKADYKGYPYSFKREGDKTVALFVTRFLPRDDTIVTGAIRDVISRSYKDDAGGAPRLVDWNASRAIRVDSKTKGYIVVPVKEDTGEIHSLVITQVAL